MTPEFVEFFDGWWQEALGRLHEKHPTLSWDRCAAMLLWMFINGEEAP